MQELKPSQGTGTSVFKSINIIVSCSYSLFLQMR